MKLYKPYLLDHGKNGNEVYVPIGIDGKYMKVLTFQSFEEEWDVDWFLDDNNVNNKTTDIQYFKNYKYEFRKLIEFLFSTLFEEM